MTFEEFKNTLTLASPPLEFSDYLRSLWYDGRNDWAKSHSIIQNIEDKTAALIHAYLHRKEGDIENADYWYQRAGKKRPDISLQDEWETIVKALI